MPHIKLEYTNNIIVEKDFKQLFSEIHQIINLTLGINPLNMKSRAVVLENYFIADGNADHAFAHLQIKILDRHKAENLTKLGEAASKILADFFEAKTNGLVFQASVEISEMKGNLYFKWHGEKIWKPRAI